MTDNQAIQHALENWQEKKKFMELMEFYGLSE